jgi:drug/metabolite transporter (DMT)-like permease
MSINPGEKVPQPEDMKGQGRRSTGKGMHLGGCQNRESGPRSDRHDNYVKGALFMLATVVLLPVSDTIAKALTLEMPVLQVVWGRLFFQGLVAASFVVARGFWCHVRTQRLGLQFGRSVLFLCSIGLFIWALSSVPLATAVALLFIFPILVTAFSALLGEKITLSRWIAVWVGFAGAITIIRPGFEATSWGALLVLCSAVISAISQFVTRHLVLIDSALTTLLYTSIGGGLVVSLLVCTSWMPMTATQWIWLALSGIVGGVVNFVMFKAFEYATPSLLAPFSYGEIPCATILGFLIFHDVPDLWTVVGAGLIILSGLYIARADARHTATTTLA